jgi:histidine triad (HIT) family protein
MASDDCFICSKHSKLYEMAGHPIVESGGLMVSHFPIVNDVPATRGHLLVEPRRHITDLSEMNDEEAEVLGKLISKASLFLKKIARAEHVYLFRINDQVPHLHFHLIPRYPNTPREFWGLKIWDCPNSPKINLDEIRKLSAELARAFL